MHPNEVETCKTSAKKRKRGKSGKEKRGENSKNIYFLTSEWGAQHPFAGWNILHLDDNWWKMEKI